MCVTLGRKKLLWMSYGCEHQFLVINRPSLRNPGTVRGFRRFVRRPADAAKLPQLSGHLFPRERAARIDRSTED